MAILSRLQHTLKRSHNHQGEVDKDEMGAGGLQGASAGENQSPPPLSKPAADAVSAADAQVSMKRSAVHFLCRQ